MLARFLPLLHKAMSEGLGEAVDDIQTAGALQLGDGWMHIHGKLGLETPRSRCSPIHRTTTNIDERNVPPLNRIGDPDDILASVRVENGKVAHFPSPVSLSSGPPTSIRRFSRRHIRLCLRIVSALPMGSLSSPRGLHRSSDTI
jgi:hypothetical protein